jgi:hypothetical protein
MANFDVAKALFSQIDTNKDGRYELIIFKKSLKKDDDIFSIDPNEFRNWVVSSGGEGGLNSSSANSSSFQSSTDGLGASSNLALVGSAGLTGVEGASGYQASYSSQTGFDSSDGLAVGGLANSYGSSSSAAAIEVAQTGGTAFEANSVQQGTQYASISGLYNDPNPQIIRRAAIGGAVTYQQKVLVRFLQPPPVPPPGVNNLSFVYIFKLICFSYYSHLLLKKFVHLNHLHRHLLLYVNKHHLFLNHLHLFYVNVLRYHLHLLLVKQVKKKKIIQLMIIILSSYSSFGCCTCSTTIGYYRTSSTSST